MTRMTSGSCSGLKPADNELPLQLTVPSLTVLPLPLTVLLPLTVGLPEVAVLLPSSPLLLLLPLPLPRASRSFLAAWANRIALRGMRGAMRMSQTPKKRRSVCR